MIEKLRTSLLEISLTDLLPKLIGKGYPYACWKMPNSESITLIVSLSEVTHCQNVGDVQEGFLFNSYNDNHPKKTQHIKADIVFTENETPRINPIVNDSQISEFIDAINSEETIVFEENSGVQTATNTEFEALVQKAVEEIRKGTFEKVVLSRYKDVDLAEDFTVSAFFREVCATYPNAFCSLIQVHAGEIWIGATPELLISDDSKRFKTAALAGTRRLAENQPLSELAWTQKEIEEQALVSRYIINCFKKIRLREFDEHGPKTVQAGNLAHLRTEFQVNYEEVQFEGLADQMLELLHPTSAVCGMPLQEAKEFIENHEGYDRGYYSGFLGPVKFSGSTDLFVNLRCLSIKEGQARFYAGAGITEDSDPAKEKDETELKMATLMSLFPT